MIKIAKIYKKPGETLANLQEKAQIMLNCPKVTFSGRLDPMAQGLVIFLCGNDEKAKQELFKLPKSYEFDVIFGISTDSFDSLGLITDFSEIYSLDFAKINNDWLAENFCQKFSAPYPPFSSRKVSGKPLFELTKKNITPLDWPHKEIEIFKLNTIKPLEIFDLKDYLEKQFKIIDSINGDFRQTEIIEAWRNFLKNKPEFKIASLKLVANVSSGTYIRWIATEIGKKLGYPAIASDINRISIGDFNYSNKDELAFFDFEDQK